MKVAFLEDDDVIRSNYVDLLESEGYEVIAMKTFADAKDNILESDPDMALLDISLPDDDQGGIKICKMLRGQNIQIPVIFFTSHSELDRQSNSWRAGADDYVTKDTNLELVLLRIKALMKRFQAVRVSVEESFVSPEIVPELQIDKDRLSANWKGKPLNLSLTQFWILQALAGDPGQALSNAQLQRVAGVVVEPNTIAAYIKSIRQTFNEIDPGFCSIKTERGRGYRWIS